MAPALVVLLSLSIYPLIYSITISLQTQTANQTSWGVSNFTRLFSDNFACGDIHTVTPQLHCL
jgi:ABC-type sugar transport system permease subunit